MESLFQQWLLLVPITQESKTVELPRVLDPFRILTTEVLSVHVLEYLQ